MTEDDSVPDLRSFKGPPMSWQHLTDAGWVWWGTDGAPVHVLDSVAILFDRRGLGLKLLAHGAPAAVARVRVDHIAKDATERMARQGLSLDMCIDSLDGVLYIEKSDWDQRQLNAIVRNAAVAQVAFTSADWLLEPGDPDLARAQRAQEKRK